MCPTIKNSTINAATANQLINDVCAYAQQKGWLIGVAVVDPSGDLIAALKMDGTIAEGLSFAVDKAYTAARLKRTTEDLWQAAEDKPFLQAGLSNRQRLLVFPGGLPIYAGQEMIGAIGISGAKSHEDIETAIYVLNQAGFNYQAS